MKLLLDPDVDLTGPGRSGLAALRDMHPTVATRFGYYPADDTSPGTPMCDRCGKTLHVHVWMLLNDNNQTTDCETETSR